MASGKGAIVKNYMTGRPFLGPESRLNGVEFSSMQTGRR
jgi:hypothetical protein